MSTAGGSMQRRRYTITSAAQQTNEYPEHLNPFHEGNEDGKANNKYTSTLGRRNSRLTASLRLKSWFPSKSSKPDESDSDSPAKPKEKFLTLTPKISRQIKDVFTHKRSKNKSEGNLAPIPQYMPTRKPLPDQFVGEEFKLAPRASRERFATPATEEERQSASPVETQRGVQPPVPLPRTILPKAEAKVRVEEIMEAPTNAEGRSADVTTSAEGSESTNLTLNITEDDNKYVRQGARPKKKRQAPLPPTQPPLPTSSKLINETDLSESTSLSASINSDCLSPSPEPSLASVTQINTVSLSPETPSPTEITKEDRLI